MVAPARARNPQAVLFACGMNSVRSPMAASLLQQMFPHALYVRSAGVKKGELDPFAVAVMAELGQDISAHRPMTFEELDDWEGLNFDLITSFSLAPLQAFTMFALACAAGMSGCGMSGYVVNPTTSNVQVTVVATGTAANALPQTLALSLKINP